MPKPEQRALQWEDSASPESRRRNNHLLLIGIDAYQKLQPLNNARRDAETFRDVMFRHYDFEDSRLYELYDEEATRRNILKTFSELCDQLGEEDNLIIYFSGHGVLHRDQGFWIPVDCDDPDLDGIPNERIQRYLDRMKAHHIYLIIDACFSGSFIPRSMDKAIDLMEANPSRRVLTSGRNEVVSDGSRGHHSPFFQAVKSFLERPSGPISAIDLEKYVIQNTPRSAHQLPLASYIHGTGDQSGQYVLYPKRNEAEDWAEARSRHEAEAYRKFIEQHPHSQHLESACWSLAQLSENISDYRHYLKAYPKGDHANEALHQMEYLEEKAAFEAAMERGEAALRRYLSKYHPDGKFLMEARTEIDRLVSLEEGGPSPSIPPSSQTQEKKQSNPPGSPSQASKNSSTKSSGLMWQIPLGIVLVGLLGLLINLWLQNQSFTQQQEETYLRLKSEGAQLIHFGDKENDLREVLFGMEKLKLARAINPTKEIDLDIENAEAWIDAYKKRMMEEGMEEDEVNNMVEGEKKQVAEMPEEEKIKHKVKENKADQIPLPRMILIEGGEFTMGSKDIKNAQPLHKVTVPSFYLSETEITNEQFSVFLNANTSDKFNLGDLIAHGLLKTGIRKDRGEGEYAPAKGYENHPVTNVSWKGAKAYTEWVSQVTGQKFALPTEAQWEYAAGGGKKKRKKYAGTDSRDEIAKFMNSKGNADGFSELAPVKRLEPNTLGLYDMSGNAWEWCEDSWHEDYTQAPTDGSAWIDREDSRLKVLRGGSWLTDESDCQVAFRRSGSLLMTNLPYAKGFRIARSL